MSAILGPILRFFIKNAGKKALPQIDGKIDVKGLSAPVEIIRDKWGIPHIFATDEKDVIFAQGFVHAQDRLFQMELHRRIASGRISEFLGKAALDTDRATRTFGFYRLAKASLAAMDDNLKALMTAYADGVNAFLKHPASRLPPEYGLVKLKPEPWKIEDSVAFGQFMGWQLSGEWKMELPRFKASVIGKEKLDELAPGYPAENPSVIPKGIDVNAATKGPYVKRGGGSNAWAISGSRTASGKPIHCNDPHLSPSTPSIWYACHLSSGSGIDVTGVSPPGIPFILIGHNAHFAWGFTVGMVDAEDLFVEKFNPDNPTQYEYMGKWCDAEIIEESIKIQKQEAPFVEKVVVTRHGPVISGVVGLPGYSLSMCSKCLQPTNAMKGFYTLARGKSWEDFVAGVKCIDMVQQNLTYADVDGNIGSYITGKVPIRKKGDGSVPIPGWTDEYEWSGEIPFDEMPHCFNPKKGFVVTANNRPVESDYKYFLSNIWDPGYRAKRITDEISSKEKFTMDDCKRLHMDNTSLPGKEFVKLLEGINEDDPDVKLAVKLLREWDGKMSPESIGGAVYDLSRYFTMRALVEVGLEKELATDLLGRGFNTALVACTELYHTDPPIMFRVLNNPDSWWVKQAGGKEALLKTGLKRAVEWLRDNVSKDPAAWQWGKVNVITFPHAFAMKKPMDKVFNVGPYPMGGNKHTVLQAGNANDEPWGQKTWIPSYRHIVDFSDISKAEFIYAPGQSGNLASPYYRNLFDLWLTGKYIPMLWTREQVEKEAGARLILVS